VLANPLGGANYCKRGQGLSEGQGRALGAWGFVAASMSYPHSVMSGEPEPQRCDRCDEANRPEARFCDSCGSPLCTQCPECATELRPQARFCDGCGSPVAQAAIERTTPKDYTPHHLADKILSSRSAIEGERKQVTVLFADLKSSLELASAVDPEVWHQILDRFFEVLTEGVHRFEGTVNQYTGDGIMALFGAPIAHEDHAQRACYASLHIRERLAEQAREVKREHGLNFSVRMGLNSGDVIVGKIGDDLRMDYTAQGLTVGLAARMEELASPDTIYLSDPTALLVEGYFDLKDLGEFRVKGLDAPVRVSELAGAGALRTRFDVSRSRGLTRFVGRDSDIKTLEDALEASLVGQGQVIGVVAEAGTGKSRLCFEFLERARARGIRVSEGRALAHGKNVPFLPLLQSFRDYFGIQERDDQRSIREKIAGRLLLLDESFRDALPIVFDLFGAPGPESSGGEVEPEARRRQLFGVLRRVVQGEGEPTISMIEDLHWLDSTSEAFLEQWVDAAPAGNGLLLVNFRPEYHAEWMHKSWYRQLPLAPLGPEAIQELLDDLLGHDPSVEGLAVRIHERTGGNPFFTEEVVQSLIESGQLEGVRGAYRMAGPIDALAIPPNVQSLLAARIDRLAEREKHVLQAAAVLGKEFSEPILRQIADVPEVELRDALSNLKDAEFIYEQAIYPVAEYAFKHPLTQEVALGSQLQERRRALHGAAARAIEVACSEKLDESAALIAHHWEEADDLRRALLCHDRAAKWVNRGDPVAAVKHWLRVSELAREIEADPEVERVQLHACASVISFGGWRLGLSAEAVDEVAADGIRLAEKLDDRGTLANLLIGMGARAAIASGDVRKYREIAREAMALDDGTLSLEDRVNVRIGAGYSAFCHGFIAESLEILESIEALCLGQPRIGFERIGYSAYPFALHMSGSAFAILGEVERAWKQLRRAVDFCREHGLPENLGWVLGTYSHLARLGGEVPHGFADLLSAVAESRTIADELGSPFSRVFGAQNDAYVHELVGEPEEAVRLGEEAISLGEELHTTLEWRFIPHVARSRALLTLGDPQGAVYSGRQALEITEQLPCYSWGVDSVCALVHGLAAAGDAESLTEGERTIARGFELLGLSGARGFHPLLLEARAAWSAARGDAHGRDRDLREALALFESFGAQGHAARLRAAGVSND